MFSPPVAAAKAGGLWNVPFRKPSKPRSPKQAEILITFSKNFFWKCKMRLSAKRRGQAQRNYEIYCIELSVHTHSQNIPTVGVSFFWPQDIRRVRIDIDKHGDTSQIPPCALSGRRWFRIDEKKRRLWFSQSRRFKRACQMVCCTTAFFLLPLHSRTVFSMFLSYHFKLLI